jgi:HEPN domain-containing protein
MPHDPELVAETRAWLAKARLDLAAADHELTAEPPFVEDIVFHAQQAAEKSFKALLTWHGKPFRKTHSLEELGEQSLGIVPELRAIVDRAVPLTDYAWKFRYPGDPVALSRDEAQGALTIARETFEAILRRLPEEVRP